MAIKKIYMNMNLNVRNFFETSNLEINVYADVVISKALARLNITAQLVDGQSTDLVVIDDGFIFVYGNIDEMEEIRQNVDAYEGVSLVRAVVQFNELFARFELVVKQLARTKECTDEHLITGILKHHGDFLYYAQKTKVRGKEV